MTPTTAIASSPSAETAASADSKPSTPSAHAATAPSSAAATQPIRRPGRLSTWLSRWLHRRIAPSFARYEAEGESFAYLEDLARSTPGGFLRFLFFMPLAGNQLQATGEQLAVARLAATAMEDCGPCLQTTARMARQAGVDPAVLRAVVEGRGGDLPEDLALVERFARSVAVGWDAAASLAETASLTQTVAETLGEGVRAEITLAIATARVFPTIKRGLGQARSCSIHPVEV